MEKINDLRDDELSYEINNNKIIVSKSGNYLCEIINSAIFKEVLAGFFNNDTGFTGNTLIEIGEFVCELERQNKIKKELQEANK